MRLNYVENTSGTVVVTDSVLTNCLAITLMGDEERVTVTITDSAARSLRDALAFHLER